MGKPSNTFHSYLLALAVTLTLGLWLVRQFAVPGVALSIIGGSVTATAYRWGAYLKLFSSSAVEGDIR